MWISKKKYNELVAQRSDFERISTNAIAQNGRLLDEWDGAIKEMKSIQELNHRLVERNEELFARIEKLETELQWAICDSQRWAEEFEELDLAYGRLETDYDRLREELSHYEYEERFRNPKEEVEED